MSYGTASYGYFSPHLGFGIDAGFLNISQNLVRTTYCTVPTNKTLFASTLYSIKSHICSTGIQVQYTLLGIYHWMLINTPPPPKTQLPILFISLQIVIDT